MELDIYGTRCYDLIYVHCWEYTKKNKIQMLTIELSEYWD